MLQLNGSPLDEMENRPMPPELEGVAGMFAQVYWYLARQSPLHPQMSQAEVDACEIHVVAMYLGVTPPGDDEDEFGQMTGDYAADAARVNARRIAAAEAKAREAARAAASEGAE